MTMELNMHGNPLVIASIYVPHDQTADNQRHKAWESIEHIVTSTPITKNLILIGDYNTSLHAKKDGR